MAHVPKDTPDALADALAAPGRRKAHELFLERILEVWWRRAPGGGLTSHTLRREGAACSSDGRLRSADGIDRFAIAALLDVPARLVPPVALVDPPVPPSLEGWPDPHVRTVRWRWSGALCVRPGRSQTITRPVLAELTFSDGARSLSTWPPPTPPPPEPLPSRPLAPPSGRVTALLAPAAAATLIHEVVGHRLEADLVDAGGGSPASVVGTRAFALPITVVDDPRRPLPGGFDHDDEGELARPRPLVEGGVIAGLLADRRHAERWGVPPGNARRSGVHAPPRPRISNLVVRAPGSDLSALRAAAAIEVRWITGATLAGRGEVWLRVREACRLRGGRPVARLGPFTLRASVAALVEGVRAVSVETETSARPGWCRKHGEVVATAADAPWLLVTGLTAA